MTGSEFSQGGAEWMVQSAQKLRELQDEYGADRHLYIPSFVNDFSEELDKWKGTNYYIYSDEQYVDWADAFTRERYMSVPVIGPLVCAAICSFTSSDYEHELAIVTSYLQDRPGYVPRLGQIISPVLMSCIRQIR